MQIDYYAVLTSFMFCVCISLPFHPSWVNNSFQMSLLQKAELLCSLQLMGSKNPNPKKTNQYPSSVSRCVWVITQMFCMLH